MSSVDVKNERKDKEKKADEGKDEEKKVDEGKADVESKPSTVATILDSDEESGGEQAAVFQDDRGCLVPNEKQLSSRQQTKVKHLMEEVRKTHGVLSFTG